MTYRTDIACYHVKTVRAGEADFSDHEGHSFVRHDGKTYYYDLTGLGVTAADWRAFVVYAWELSDEDENNNHDVGIYDKKLGTFYADVD